MKTLFDIFRLHNGRQIDKWVHYFPIYEKHFARFRGKKIRVLELGIDHGGSLQMWKEYFGSFAEIIGVDIVDCTAYIEPQITIVQTDQCNPKLGELGPFDIVIDDGSHYVDHQTISFEYLWPHCTGVYLIEDCQGWQIMPGTNTVINVGDCLPTVRNIGGLEYLYPWVAVYERPVRMIRGNPSRELREDEQAARDAFGP